MATCTMLRKRANQVSRALTNALNELDRAQKRRNSLRTYGRGDLTKREHKAQVAVKEAVQKVKTASGKLVSTERALAKCLGR